MHFRKAPRESSLQCSSASRWSYCSVLSTCPCPSRAKIEHHPRSFSEQKLRQIGPDGVAPIPYFFSIRLLSKIYAGAAWLHSGVALFLH